MAAPRTQDPPHALRLSLARARARGRSFDVARAAALPAALAQARAFERRHWRIAFLETEDVWRAAFEGTPAARSVLALEAVAVDPEREPIAT